MTQTARAGRRPALHRRQAASKLLAGGAAVTPVARGEIEMTVTTIPGILEEPGAELVGPLPDELQSWLVYTAAVASGAKEPDTSGAWIAFLPPPRKSRRAAPNQRSERFSCARRRSI